MTNEIEITITELQSAIDLIRLAERFGAKMSPPYDNAIRAAKRLAEELTAEQNTFAPAIQLSEKMA